MRPNLYSACLDEIDMTLFSSTSLNLVEFADPAPVGQSKTFKNFCVCRLQNGKLSLGRLVRLFNLFPNISFFQAGFKRSGQG
jgi:hypothetical protein